MAVAGGYSPDGGGVENLGGKREQQENAGDDFAGAALRQPALDPREDGAGKQQIEEREEREGEDRPEADLGAGDADADGDGCGPDDADEGGRRGETVNNVKGDPRTEADGIAKEVAKFGIWPPRAGARAAKNCHESRRTQSSSAIPAKVP